MDVFRSKAKAGMVISIAAAVAVLSVSGCASGAKKASLVPSPAGDLEALRIDGPVELSLKGQPGQSEKVAYFNKSVTRTFDSSGKVRDRAEETLEFTAQAQTTKVESDKITQVISTIAKNGAMSLHSFAMPELNEKLEVISTVKGKILRAGAFPPNSIFYVPPVSLPEGQVRIGDTWTLNATWVSLEEGIPFRLEMVSILKGFYKCGDDRCAAIEISGDVGVDGELGQLLGFKSHWQGHLLFAMNAGTTVWSHVASQDSFLSDKMNRKVDSCLEALMLEPAGLKLKHKDKPGCAPPVE